MRALLTGDNIVWASPASHPVIADLRSLGDVQGDPGYPEGRRSVASGLSAFLSTAGPSQPQSFSVQRARPLYQSPARRVVVQPRTANLSPRTMPSACAGGFTSSRIQGSLTPRLEAPTKQDPVTVNSGEEVVHDEVVDIAALCQRLAAMEKECRLQTPELDGESQRTKTLLVKSPGVSGLVKAQPVQSASFADPELPPVSKERSPSASAVKPTQELLIEDTSLEVPPCALRPDQPRIELRSLVDHPTVRERMLGVVSTVVLSRCRGVSPWMRRVVAAHLDSTCLATVATKTPPQPARVQQTEEHAKPLRLAHISKMLDAPLIARPRGTFDSKVGADYEVARDFSRNVLAPSRRMYLMVEDSERQLLRLGPSLSRASIADSEAVQWAPRSLREGLEAQLRGSGTQMLTARELDVLSSGAVIAMSAGIGVDFAVQVGLQPTVLQPLFLVVVFRSASGAVQARVLMFGFVAKVADQIVGSQPESKYSAWTACLGSPDLLQSDMTPGSRWTWEYSVKDAHAKMIQECLDCDMGHLQDGARSGSWPGLL